MTKQKTDTKQDLLITIDDGSSSSSVIQQQTNLFSSKNR
jgi:hypothetical protein